MLVLHLKDVFPEILLGELTVLIMAVFTTSHGLFWRLVLTLQMQYRNQSLKDKPDLMLGHSSKDIIYLL